MTSRRGIFALSLLVASLAGACGEPNPRAADIVALTPDVENGENLYTASCTGCHAADGTGTDDGPALIGEIAAHSDEDIISYFLDGIPNEGVPSFEDDFTDQEAAGLMGFLNSL